MRNIFIGLLFVFIDFNLDVGASRIGLIPDFVGFLLILGGLSALAAHSARFEKVRPLAIGMAIYSGVLYGADLLGISFHAPLLAFVLGLVATVLSLYLSYEIVMGIKDIEVGYDLDLEADSLFSVWKLHAIFSIGSYVLLLIPVLALICILIGLVISICFLYCFYRSRRLYESHFPLS